MCKVSDFFLNFEQKNDIPAIAFSLKVHLQSLSRHFPGRPGFLELQRGLKASGGVPKAKAALFGQKLLTLLATAIDQTNSRFGSFNNSKCYLLQEKEFKTCLFTYEAQKPRINPTNISGAFSPSPSLHPPAVCDAKLLQQFHKGDVAQKALR